LLLFQTLEKWISENKKKMELRASLEKVSTLQELWEREAKQFLQNWIKGHSGNLTNPYLEFKELIKKNPWNEKKDTSKSK
jgi:ribonuclease HI